MMRWCGIFVFLVFFAVASCGRMYRGGDGTGVALSAAGVDDAGVLPEGLAGVLYERLMASFADDWRVREMDPGLYPDFYGGAFVGDDGRLVVAVTGDGAAERVRLAGILGTEDFVVESVAYSYGRMLRVSDSIEVFLADGDVAEDHLLMRRFAGAFPDVTVNRVRVLLTVMDSVTVRLFREVVVDSPVIMFEQGELPGLM
ncbi:MAG: hypothetical protein LBH72_07895 [Proteiniphilum sp.]|nr:hypothetical protein [Proteiniphilum sp.]